MTRFWFIFLNLCFVATIFAMGCSPNYRLPRENAKQSSAWPFYRSDTQATGSAPSGSFSGKLEVIWKRSESGKSAGPLILSHNTLVYPSARKRIKFFDVLSGKFLGKIKIKGVPQTGVVIYDSLAFFGVSPNRNSLYCINLYNGNTVWQNCVKDAPDGSIILNNRLMVGSRDGVLTAYDLETGKQEWTFHTDGRLTAPVAGFQDMLYQGDDKGNLYALSAIDGTLQFRVALDGPLVSAPVLSELLTVADMTGKVYGIDRKNGQQLWKKELGSSIWSAPAVSEATVFIGLTSGYLVALDARTGDEQWRFRTENVVRAAPVVVGEYVLVGTLTGKLFCLNTADGKLIDQYQLSGTIRYCPVSDGNRVYVATESGVIACYGEKNNEETQ